MPHRFSINRRFFATSACALMALGFLCSIAVTDADARERSRSGSYSTSGGRSGTIDTSASKVRGEGLKRQKNVTTSSGKGATVDTARSYTKGEGVSTNKDVTTLGGKTGGYDKNTTYDKESGTYESTVAGHNGKSVTYTGTASDGQRSGTYTTSG